MILIGDGHDPSIVPLIIWQARKGESCQCRSWHFAVCYPFLHVDTCLDYLWRLLALQVVDSWVPVPFNLGVSAKLVEVPWGFKFTMMWYSFFGIVVEQENRE